MSVPLRLKFPSDPVITSMWEQVTNTPNTVWVFLFFYTKFICHYSFLVVTDKKETEYEKKSTALEKERTDTDLDIFLVFFCSSHICLLGVLSSHLRGRCENSSRTSLQNGCRDFRTVFISSRLVSNSPFSCSWFCVPHNSSFTFVFSRPSKPVTFFQPIRACFLIRVHLNDCSICVFSSPSDFRIFSRPSERVFYCVFPLTAPPLAFFQAHQSLSRFFPAHQTLFSIPVPLNECSTCIFSSPSKPVAFFPGH